MVLRRCVYDINSSNKNISEQAKRMAINTVIQGSAANIIKKVMIEIFWNICTIKLKCYYKFMMSWFWNRWRYFRY